MAEDGLVAGAGAALSYVMTMLKEQPEILSFKREENVEEMLKDRVVDIYIDAKELDYIDSTGLGTIIGIYKILKEDDKQIYMENLKPNVRKMFKITDLDQIIRIKE